MRSEFLAWMIRGAALAIGVALVLALVALGVAAGRVLLIVFVAILLASALEPMIGWIRTHVGLRRGLTILLVYAGFFVTVVGLALVVLPAAVNQFNDIVAFAVPVTASIVVVLQRLQAREIPVAQDPASVGSEKPDETEGLRRGLPDGAAADP